MQTEDHERKVK